MGDGGGPDLPFGYAVVAERGSDGGKVGGLLFGGCGDEGTRPTGPR